MSLEDKIKKLFKRGNKQLSTDKVEILPNTSKYKNMTLFAPDRGMNADTFYILARDENNEPITNETIKIEIDGEIIEKKTNANGNINFEMNLKLGQYVANVFFPNGEYSPSIETNITRLTKKKKAQ